jgi:competence protein ComFC
MNYYSKTVKKAAILCFNRVKMTSIIDSISSYIAPHCCIICCNEGNSICESCFFDCFDETENCCFKCGSVAQLYETCQKCQPYTALDGLFVFGAFDETLKTLIHEYKYERKLAVARDIAPYFTEHLPYFDTSAVSYVPSSHQHRRQRGYDQGEELARAYARLQHVKCYRMVERIGHDIQVGAKRRDRQVQAKKHFQHAKSTRSAHEVVLLFDDVVTTGSSMERCAALIKETGVQTVFGVAIARDHL